MNNPTCPHCRAQLAPFHLLENNPSIRTVFAGATLAPGLAESGLRCANNRDHVFGFRYGAFVEIEAVIAQAMIEPPDSALAELPGDTDPWFNAEGWYVVKEPGPGELRPGIEGARLADGALDRRHRGNESGYDSLHYWLEEHEYDLLQRDHGVYIAPDGWFED